MTKKLQVWTTLSPEEIEKFDLICKKKYWTRPEGYRKALIAFLKYWYKVPVENNVNVRDNRGAN